MVNRMGLSGRNLLGEAVCCRVSSFGPSHISMAGYSTARQNFNATGIICILRALLSSLSLFL